VLYIPGLQDNLISEGKLDLKGMSINRKNGITTISDDTDVILKGFRVGTLYYVTTQGSTSIEEIEKKYKYIGNKVSKVSSDIWHSRLGHINKESLKRISPLEGHLKKDVGNDCESCIHGKFKRLKFQQSEDKTSTVLQRIHSVCGPMPCKSEGSNRYFVTFFDNYSNYIIVVPTKRKS
jgi:hypothetical protein